MTLTEGGKVALEPMRDRTLTLNFPESMMALRIGAPIVPEACDSQYLLSRRKQSRAERNTYSDNSNVLNDNSHFEAYQG